MVCRHHFSSPSTAICCCHCDSFFLTKLTADHLGLHTKEQYSGVCLTARRSWLESTISLWPFCVEFAWVFSVYSGFLPQARDMQLG